ncbi:sigma factor-like helix-turn-helix DNA-binding protein [Streptomyces sp. NPDC006482]|uniref:sigma factor-like helix-turn-helix DNA-binding protein n=1 Tax=Streptomyces sp. NPDC006482 TaxID=3154306 RepID=UPI0033B072CF
MDDDDVLAASLTDEAAPFKDREDGPRLRAVAYRLLGSFTEAEEAVRETARRLAGGGPATAPPGRLTDTLARICLERLRTRETHRSAPWDPWDPWTAGAPGEPHRPEQVTDPEQRALLADAPSPALLTALDALTPSERLAFVLHDLFDIPYEEIAPALERTPVAARQLATRARHRVRGTEEMPEADPARQEEVVAAFLAASRDGDPEALLPLLDPDVALRADTTAVRTGVAAAHGARPVARALAGPTREARQALLDGAAGLALTREGRPHTVFAFTVLDSLITSVDALADEDHLNRLDVRLRTENTPA